MEKTFHFQELNWLVAFPNSGNERKKYGYYTVFFTDLKKRNVREEVILSVLLENKDFEERFPHTVGFFKSEMPESSFEIPGYLELRLIRSIEDFWKFLNDLDL